MSGPITNSFSSIHLQTNNIQTTYINVSNITCNNLQIEEDGAVKFLQKELQISKINNLENIEPFNSVINNGNLDLCNNSILNVTKISNQTNNIIIEPFNSNTLVINGNLDMCNNSITGVNEINNAIFFDTNGSITFEKTLVNGNIEFIGSNREIENIASITNDDSLIIEPTNKLIIDGNIDLSFNGNITNVNSIAANELIINNTAKIDISENNTNAHFFPIFTRNYGSNQTLFNNNKLKYNPNNNVLSVDNINIEKQPFIPFVKNLGIISNSSFTIEPLNTGFSSRSNIIYGTADVSSNSTIIIPLSSKILNDISYGINGINDLNFKLFTTSTSTSTNNTFNIINATTRPFNKTEDTTVSFDIKLSSRTGAQTNSSITINYIVFHTVEILTINSSFIQFPKAQGDVILQDVEVDGDVLMNSLRTPDKIVNSWVSRSTDNQQWAAITWSPELGIFCAVARQTSSGTQKVMTSSDGINWVLQNTPLPGGSYESIVWAAEANNRKGRFVAPSLTGTNRVMYSDNGIDWLLSTTSPPANSWTSIAWSPNLELFCIVSSNGSNRVATSPDGITWTPQSVSTGEWTGVVWSVELKLFCAVSRAEGNVMLSNDGTNWDYYVTHNQLWRDVAWSPELGLFCAVNNATTSTTSRVMISSDGKFWELIQVSNLSWQHIIWAAELGLFVAVARLGTGDRIMTSTNGRDWNYHSATNNYDWRGLTWSPELYMLVATSVTGSTLVTGSSDRVMTTREASKPLLSNTSKQVESTAQPLTIMSPLSGTTSNIQDQLTATPNVFENDGVPTKVTTPKILFGTITTSNSGAVASVTFDPPFNNTPYVFATMLSPASRVPIITNVTTTGFAIDSIQTNGSRSEREYNWVAIGN
jgi:hypothetical protein